MFAATVRRRCWVMSLFVLAVAGCAGTQSSEKMIQIGTTKASLLGPPTEYRALQLRLEDLFESRVVFTPQPDGPAIGTQLDLGNIQFAILSAKEYCEIKDSSNLKMLATAVNPTGKTTSTAKIITRSGSSIEKITDLKGKRFAFGTRGDLLTDLAVQAALKKAGLPPKELATELLPPPIAYEGRLYAGSEAPNKVAIPILRGDVIPISGGVIGEVAWEALSATGGNVITGPAQDDFRVIGETIAVPDALVVAGPSTSVADVSAMKQFLLNQAGQDPNICKQMGIKGFAEPDDASYDLARLLLSQSE